MQIGTQCNSSNWHCCIRTDFPGIRFGCMKQKTQITVAYIRIEACFFFFPYVKRSLVDGVALVAAGVGAKMSAILWGLFSRPKEGRRDKSKVQK